MMDNHKIYTSIETQEHLETVPDKFEFVFTPKHASWLNIIESFFSKMTRSVLRGIRADSVNELRERISRYINFSMKNQSLLPGNIKLKKGTKCPAEL